MLKKRFVEAAIEKVHSTFQVVSPDTWKAFNRVCDECILALETKASGQLHAFEVVPSQYNAFYLDPSPEVLASAEIVNLADNLWCWIGGGNDPEQAVAVIAATCIEFTRWQFDSALTGIAFAASELELCEWARNEAKTIPEMMLVRPWHDADAIARNPCAPTWFNQSAALGFHEWLYSTLPGTNAECLAYKSREPIASMQRLPDEIAFRAAIALVWLDEAMRDPVKSLELMAAVASATSDCGLIHGRNSRDTMDVEGRTSFSRKGTDARHFENRKTRAALISAFKAGNFSSKDAAATTLAEQFGIGWRTAREHLKGV